MIEMIPVPLALSSITTASTECLERDLNSRTAFSVAGMSRRLWNWSSKTTFSEPLVCFIAYPREKMTTIA